jgi:U3 small nucleolar RNA-associated protein 15
LKPRPGKPQKDYRYFQRGVYEEPKAYDQAFEETKLRALKNYEKFLKKFEYKQALQAALKMNQTDVILSLIEELIEREGLEIALTGLNEQELAPIFGIILSKLSNPQYTNILIPLGGLLLSTF